MNDQQYKSIMILAIGMVMGVSIFSVVFVYLQFESGVPFNTNYSDPVILGCCGAGIAMLPMGLFLYRSLVSKAREKEHPEEKIISIRSAIIIRSAVWEVGAILNLVAFYLTHSIVPLVIVGCTILLFLLFFPTRSRVLHDLEMDR